jgi:hypothetical protein
VTTSAFPIEDEALLEKVRALAGELGEWPSKRSVMRAAGVGAPRAAAALAALRAEGFEPAPARALAVVPDADAPALEVHPKRTSAPAPGAPEAVAPGVPGRIESAARVEAEPHAGAGADAGDGARERAVPRWPLLIIALPAFVAVWSGWVGLGRLTGFGPVALLPGIADSLVINTAVTLPIGVEVYAAYAIWIWLSNAPVTRQARAFARWSALGALALGALGQVAYHLMVAAGMDRAPWPITAGVSCLPVVVIGCAAALVHLAHRAES